MVDADRTKDARGLTPQQRRYLMELASGKTQRQAAEAIGIAPATAKQWRRNADFKRELMSLFDGQIDATKVRLTDASHTAVDVLMEAMEATKGATVTAKCPECGHMLEIDAKVPNWNARLRAGELVLRSAKVLKDVKEIEGSITHLALEERIALGLFKSQRWDQIPSYMWEKLQTMGLIPPDIEQPTNPYRLVEGSHEDSEPIGE